MQGIALGVSERVTNSREIHHRTRDLAGGRTQPQLDTENTLATTIARFARIWRQSVNLRGVYVQDGASFVH